MKRFIQRLCLALVLLSSGLRAQDLSIQISGENARSLLNSDINEGDNKQMLLDKLDEIKERINNHYERLRFLNYQKRHLVQYQAVLREVSYETLELSFIRIGAAMRSKDVNLQLLEERRLENRLSAFFNQFEKDETTEARSEDSLGFQESFYAVLGNLKAEPPLVSFMNRSKGICFFQDSLQIRELKAVLFGSLMDAAQTALRSTIQKQKDYIAHQEFAINKEINAFNNLKRRIEEKINEKADIDLFSIVLGLPLFCFTIIFLFIGPGWVQSRYGKGELNPLLEKSQSILLDLSTVLLLTLSVLILGLSGNINGDVLGTLIGGISGYVLNKSKG